MINAVPIDAVRPDPNQPRRIFSDSHIKGLAESLKIEGLINPIEVDQNLMIITGECRWRAAKEAGWSEVLVNINDKKLSEYERFRRQMAENLHQSAAGGSTPMNAIDVARGYKKLIELRTHKDYQPGLLSREDIYGLMSDLPKELGITKQTIYEYLHLLEEPKHILEDISKGKPRTIYREADRLPEKYRDRVKEAIAEGTEIGREDVRRFARLAVRSPEKAEIEFLRLTHTQSESANRILNRAIELELAMKSANVEEFTPQDKKMIGSELKIVLQSVDKFLKLL